MQNQHFEPLVKFVVQGMDIADLEDTVVQDMDIVDQVDIVLVEVAVQEDMAAGDRVLNQVQHKD